MRHVPTWYKHISTVYPIVLQIPIYLIVIFSYYYYYSSLSLTNRRRAIIPTQRFMLQPL